MLLPDFTIKNGTVRVSASGYDDYIHVKVTGGDKFIIHAPDSHRRMFEFAFRYRKRITEIVEWHV
jgi:hypothetical protein